MELINLRCPECGASLDVSSDREFFFCTYCGTKLMMPDNVAKRYVKIDKTYKEEKVYRDESAIERSKAEFDYLKHKEDRNSALRALRLWIGMMLLMLLLIHLFN